MKQKIELHPNVQGRLRAIALAFDGVRVDAGGGAYEELSALAQGIQREQEGKTAGQIAGVGEARRLYREFGLDPTRTRPSSEALLRRALRGLELYRVCNVVDVGNLVSLGALLPLGLYDLDHIVGDRVELRIGEPGEGYEGIRKGRVNVEERLCVADGAGACGSPTSDSLRTSIRESTQSVLCILFAPIDGERSRIEGAAARMVELLLRHAAARPSGRWEFLGS